MNRPKKIEVLSEDLLDEDWITKELSLEETILSQMEEPRLKKKSYRVEKLNQEPLLLVLDISMSMSGENLALIAVGLAMMMIYTQGKDFSVVLFESSPTVLKRFSQKMTIHECLYRFLHTSMHGYTHLENGLKKALELSKDKKNSKPVKTLILTDGKYTAGKNPIYLAHQFQSLSVMKTGEKGTEEVFCRELARVGKGQYDVVEDLHDLPASMYRLIRTRGLDRETRL